jgi:CRP/FNR family cyclic AMP-dependent transcriptional regulator
MVLAGGAREHGGLAQVVTRHPSSGRISAPAAPTARDRHAATPDPLDHAAYLAQVPLFADLDSESLRQLASVAHRRAFRAGAVIFNRGDPGQVLYVIRQGKVKIYLTSPDGQELALAVFGPGECFGELALLDGQPRSAAATAIEPVETYAVQRSAFISAVMHHPRIAIQVMNVLSCRLRQTDEMIQDLLFLDVHGRVAKKLLELCETHGVRTPQGIRIELRLTQADLAAMVGASRESVNKAMGYLTAKQYITTDKHRTTVTRLAELRRRVC